MKKFKKIASLLLALVMVCALGTTAFATTIESSDGNGSITITNAVEDETYSVYKMLNLSYNSTTESYSYTIATDWEDFFTSANGFTVTDGYVTAWTATSTITSAADLAKAALAYAQTNSISATASGTADENGIEFTGLALGYYLVDTSLGTLCSIDSTATSVEIEEKNNTEPQFDKTVDDNQQSNTASIGDVLEYTITISDIENKSSVVVSDTLSSGLTLNTTSITVTVNGSTVTAGDNTYTLDTTTTNSFTITFEDDYLVGMTYDIVITYSATINENAVIYTNVNKNSATLEYGNQSMTDVVETTVYQFELKKVDNKGNSLTGAEFTLYDSDNNPIYVVAVDGGYRVATSSTETDATTTITAGDVVIKGLAAGTYTLKESKAPTGYNQLAEDQTVTINSDGTVSLNNGDNESLIEIVNQAGSELPSTGGIGTTIFYVVGTIMVLGAVVVLITRKRMSAQ